MPLQIVKNDITKMKVDAIVNAANSSLLGGGGVDGCIHRVAGPELLKECRLIGPCQTGDVKITNGYNLPSKYVIHAVGPIWAGGSRGEKDLLVSAYQKSLELAKNKNCQSLAFPLISSGAYGYPKDQALRAAVDTISKFLMENDMMVYLVIFDKASYRIGEKIFSEIVEYIDENYDGVEVAEGDSQNRNILKSMKRGRSYSLPSWKAKHRSEGINSDNYLEAISLDSLDEALKDIDESFSEMLLRKIDELGMTDSECYKKANIDRKLFSKIRSDRLYRPSKVTALAFAIALELPLEEAKDFLMKAGFALSRSNKFDIIVEFFIEKGNYDIFEINEALFAFDQRLLGA